MSTLDFRPGSGWSIEEKLLFSALRPCCTTSEIHDVFTRCGYDRSPEAVDRRGRRVGIRFAGFGEPAVEELTPEQVSALAEVLEGRPEDPAGTDQAPSTDPPPTSLTSAPELWVPPIRVPRVVVDTTAADLLSKLKQIKEEVDRGSPPAAPPTPTIGSTVVLLLSDLHFGNQTKDFNIEIATDRITGIPGKLLPYLPSDCKEIVVALAGDVVEGEEIYPTQQSNIEKPLIFQVEAATRALWAMLLGFRKLGKTVKVYTCPGNHGRMSKTANEMTNWDNVVYMQLGILADMNKDPNLHIQVNFDEFYRFPLRDRWGLMYHKGVKHTGTAAMRVKLAGWMIDKPWAVLVHGHHHHWEVGTIFGRPVVKNGCLVGQDDLAERMGEMDPPRQAYFLARDNEPFYGFSYLEWPVTSSNQKE